MDRGVDYEKSLITLTQGPNGIKIFDVIMPPVSDYILKNSAKFSLLSAYCPKVDLGYAANVVNYAKKVL